jgi:hypothetical protein
MKKGLIEKIKKQVNFLTQEDLDDLLSDPFNDVGDELRLRPVLVRCGGGRFTCPLQDVKHFIQIIKEHDQIKEYAKNADYVRDVSIPTHGWFEINGKA